MNCSKECQERVEREKELRKQLEEERRQREEERRQREETDRQAKEYIKKIREQQEEHKKQVDLLNKTLNQAFQAVTNLANTSSKR